MNKSTLLIPTLGALVASVALVGCNRQEGQGTAGQRSDTVVAKSEQKGEAMKDRSSQAATEARSTAREGAQDAKQAGQQASERAGNAVNDAVITTSVNAELAKDKKLSALKIDVDTAGGRVALHGTAPDAASKERATQLAQNVKGVVGVDNELTVQQK
jgi:hyperosmotically inducible protein